MIDLGEGTPIVLIPGIQGRWEWMAAGVEALASRARVVTYTLCGDGGSNCTLDEAAGFENYVRQLDEVFEEARLQRAAVCGVSYGGLIATHYAALRPERVTALILVSAPGPRWKPEQRVMKYLRSPRLLAPLFIVRSPMVIAREVAAAFPKRRDRWAFRRRHLIEIMRAPLSPVRMAQRVKFALDMNFIEDCKRIKAPTLVMIGEEELDQIVPIESTRDYLRAIPGAKEVIFEGTGHLGIVTRPAKFAETVCAFAAEAGEAGEAGRAGMAGGDAIR